MRKLIIAGIVCLSMLMSRQAFAVSSAAYGVTTTTNGDAWTTCLPKIPGAGFTTTGLCYTSSASGGIGESSTAPISHQSLHLFNEGLSATTISAGTYYNLPSSGLTQATYITAPTGQYATATSSGLNAGLPATNPAVTPPTAFRPPLVSVA